MSKLKLFFITLSLLTITFNICGCSTENDSESRVSVSDTTLSDNDDFDIKTDRINIKYPTQWEEYLLVEENDDSVDFIAEINGKKELVFTMHFNKSGELYFGSLSENGTDTAISFSFNNFEDLDSSWNDEEKNILYSMQEDVNYIMDSIRSKDNFKENG